MRRWIVIALVAALLGGGGWFWLRHRNSRPHYVTAEVERGEIEQRVVATGTVNAVTTVQVGSQVSGRIVKLHADFNSRVEKGQLIAELDPSLFQAQVDQARGSLEIARASVQVQTANLLAARANMENAEHGIAGSRAAVQSVRADVERLRALSADARRNWERNEELFKRNLISRGDRDTARTTYEAAAAQAGGAAAQVKTARERLEQAEAQFAATRSQWLAAKAQLLAAAGEVKRTEASLEVAQANLRYSRIYAPVRGIVVARNVDEGQTVAASLQAPTLFLIAEDLTKMKVDANIDEADVGRVKEGKEATFTVDAFPDETFKGRVTQVRNNPTTIQNVVTYNAVIEVANPALKLKPGMTANLSILITQRDNVILIPNAALRFEPPGEKHDRARGEGTGKGGPRENGGARRGKRAGVEGERPVWLLTSRGTPERRMVTLGITDGRSTEVVSGGLAEHDRVITGIEETKKGARGNRLPTMPSSRRRF